MPKNPFKKNYVLNLEKSLIFVILCISLIFYLFPKNSNNFTALPPVPRPVLQIMEIPRTVQEKRTSRPRPTLPVIPVAVDDPGTLDDVTITYESRSIDGDTTVILTAEQVGQLSFIPRQTLEVVPGVEAGEAGYIKIDLHIGKNGKVINYKILENTTN